MKNLLPILALLFSAFPAHAVESINVQTFNPSTSDRFVLLEDGFKSEWPKSAKYYFGVNYNYVAEPFVATNAAETIKLYNIIDSIQTVDMMFGFKPTSRLGLFFGLPLHFVGYPNNPGSATFPTGSASGMGDLKLLAKIRLTDETAPLAVALIPEFHLPTGSTENFVSDASTFIGTRLALERTFSNNFTFVGNLGFVAASNSIYRSINLPQTIDYRKRLIFGLGGFLPFTDTWGMSVEFNSTHMLPFDKSINPNELYAGLRHMASESTILTAGASLGKIGGVTGQTFRFIAGLRYTLFDDTQPAPVVYNPPVMPLATPAPTPVKAPRVAVAPVAPVVVPVPVQPTQPAVQPRAVLRAKRIELLTPVNFENDSARLHFESKGILDDVADIMKKNKTAYKKIIIDGHTNNIGGDKYNLKLSIARAKAVKSYLVSKGIPANVLEARGFGQRKPKVSYKDPKAIEINRRVEFIVVK